MRKLFRQLEFVVLGGKRSPSAFVTSGGRAALFSTSRSERPTHLRGRDRALESKARELLRQLGADKLAREVRVKWNPRMRSAAGRADYRERLISLNPLLLNLGDGFASTEIGHGPLECYKHSSTENELRTPGSSRRLECNMHSSLTRAGESSAKKGARRALVRDEIDRTLRHELAHLLAQFRVGRRRIAPHGPEWRQACRDLGIADEARCHNLPFASKTHAPRYVYRCPNCRAEFPRVREIRRAIACLACCRKHNGGEFDPRFRLKLISTGACPAVAFGEGGAISIRGLG
jgi:predicted SprT family Zn-dependent metalloprotease